MKMFLLGVVLGTLITRIYLDYDIEKLLDNLKEWCYNNFRKRGK